MLCRDYTLREISIFNLPSGPMAVWEGGRAFHTKGRENELMQKVKHLRKRTCHQRNTVESGFLGFFRF